VFTNWLLTSATVFAILLAINLIGLAFAITYGRSSKRKTHEDTAIAIELISAAVASNAVFSDKVGEQLARLKPTAVKTALLASALNFTGDARKKILAESTVRSHIEKGTSDLRSRFWWRRLDAVCFLHHIIDPDETVSTLLADSNELVRSAASIWLATTVYKNDPHVNATNTPVRKPLGCQSNERVVPLSSPNANLDDMSDGLESAELLVQLLDHENWDSRYKAARALADLGDPGLLVLKMASRRAGTAGRQMANHMLEKRSLNSRYRSNAA